MRVVFCWTQFSGYMAACWRALGATPGIELLILGRAANEEERRTTAFAADTMAGLPHRTLSQQQMHDPSYVVSLVDEARPDVLVLAGWGVAGYRKLPQWARRHGVRVVMTMDNPIQLSLRQKLARLKVGPWVRRMDAVVVPGERAWQYARYLGVAESRLARGVYAFNDEPLAPIFQARGTTPAGWPEKFLYVGRYHPDKAIDTLLDGYRIYRTLVQNPWPLDCSGMGPLAALVRGEGVTDLGFVQPHQQGQVWASHGAFVLASRYEPWGVAVAEAAASGLPIVCTEACGASVELVRNCYNGVTVPTDNPSALAGALKWMHHNHGAFPTMGARSRELALPFSTPFWAKRWTRLFEQITGKTLE